MVVDEKKPMNKKQQSGRSMIEMIGVLSIMALVTAGAFALIANGTSSQKRNRAVDDMVEITTGTRSIYAEHEDLPTINSTTLLSALSKSATGPYTGSTYSVERLSNTTFAVKLTGLPEGDCTALGIKEWKVATAHSCTKNSSGKWVISITVSK